MNVRQAAIYCLIASLAAGLAFGPALAADNVDQRPIRLFASARFSPIGTLRMSSVMPGAVAIDGRLAQGEESLWGGELIRVFDDHRVSIDLDTIGRVTLSRGAMIRLGDARASDETFG